MDKRKVVVLSGPMAAGKTTLADHLVRSGKYVAVRARDELLRLGAAPSRSSLLEVGARIEQETEGAWLLIPVDEVSEAQEGVALVVDSIRTENQLKQFHDSSGDTVHIHLTASFDERKRRTRESSDVWREANSHPTERGIGRLRSLADLVVDTTSLDVASVVAVVKAFLAGDEEPS